MTPSRPPPCPRDPTRPDRAASRDLKPVPESAAEARACVRETLAQWGLLILAADAEVITAELVANAIAAAESAIPGPPLVLTVLDRPPELHLYIWDPAPGAPAPRAAAAGDERGRGLAIVDALTGHRWGWFPCSSGGGKVVWAAMTASPLPVAVTAEFGPAATATAGICCSPTLRDVTGRG